MCAFAAVGLLVMALASTGLAADGAVPLDTGRVAALAAMLPEKPAAPGPGIEQRDQWAKLKQAPGFATAVARAEALLSVPLPADSEELYLEFSRTGQRTHYQELTERRRTRLTPLVLAECIENKGRFLPAIEDLIASVCAERAWVLPAADEKLKNFHGEIVEIDLWSSKLAWNLAIADSLLGERLKPAVRTMLRENVDRRVLTPYLQMIRGQSPAVFLHGRDEPSTTMHWLTTKNNWNAVCLAGVTGAALAQIESRQTRAEFIAAAEVYSSHFLAGFTSDGYCSEGLGYWNYGFGHFVMLSETIRRATGGNVDLLSAPEARMPSRFGRAIEILNGISPAFADCPIGAKPSASILRLLDRREGVRDPADDRNPISEAPSTLFEALIYGIELEPVASSAPATTTAPRSTRALPVRDWFDVAGVLVGRPRPGEKSQFAVALKGGHNGESHNHNDVGSFVVVNGNQAVLLDPGSEVYTARTFSSRRYESKLLNSFGHPVPVVAGQLQRTGKAAAARVLRSEFSDSVDKFELDLTSVYAVPALKDLRRTFVYGRDNGGSLEVIDNVEMTTPQAFGTALLTLGSWKRESDRTLLVTTGELSLRIDIDTGGLEFSIDAEEIHENAPVKPTRLGINLRQPTAKAMIRLTIRPL